MFFSGEMVALVLYSFQQFGVMLGVGAETILLVVYLMSLRDGVVEPKEAQFARAIRKTLYIGLCIIIFSGAGIAGYHALLGQIGIILQPAFLTCCLRGWWEAPGMRFFWCTFWRR